MACNSSTHWRRARFSPESADSGFTMQRAECAKCCLTYHSACRQRRDINVLFSERELTFTFTICRRPSSVCRLSSVTFVHPTHAIEIFANVSTPFGTLAISDLSVKILRRCPRGTPPVGGLNARRVAKYSDFGHFKGYISDTMQN